MESMGKAPRAGSLAGENGGQEGGETASGGGRGGRERQQAHGGVARKARIGTYKRGASRGQEGRNGSEVGRRGPV